MTNPTPGGSGQAPASQDTTGQAPASTPQAAPLGSDQNGQAPAGTSTDEAKWRAELAEARRDAAKYRDELKKLTNDQLSKKEKREQEKTENQTRLAQLEATNRRLSLENAGHQLAASLGIADMRAALAIIKSEHEHEIKYDEDTQQPRNLDTLLKHVLAEHPVLAVQQHTDTQAANGQQNGQRPAASSGGATNPGAGARSGVLTREAIMAMSPGEAAARVNEINAWLANGGH